MLISEISMGRDLAFFTKKGTVQKQTKLLVTIFA